MGWLVNATTPPFYPWEKPVTHCIVGCVVPRAGLDGCRKCTSTGIRSPARPARSQSQNDRDLIEVIHLYLLATHFCTKQAKVCAAGCGSSFRAAVCMLCHCRGEVICPFSSGSLPGCVVGIYVSVGTAVIISWCFYFQELHDLCITCIIKVSLQAF